MGQLISVENLAFFVGAASLAAPVTLIAGSNITLTPSGNSLTIAASGGGGGATTALDNLASTAINASLIPAVPATIDLGAVSFAYANGYINKIFTDTGTNLLPAYSFNGRTDVGFLFVQSPATIALSDTSNLSIPGTQYILFGSTDLSAGVYIQFDGTNLTFNPALGPANISLAPGMVLLLDDGSAAAPSYTFSSDPTTGIYRDGQGIGFSVLGAETCRITPGLLIVDQGVDIFPNGTTPISPSAINGFVYLPVSSGGPPTGNPENDGATFFDAAASKLWVFSVANGWKGIVLV